MTLHSWGAPSLAGRVVGSPTGAEAPSLDSVVCTIHTNPGAERTAFPHITPCGGWLLITCPHGNYRWRPLLCHSWACPQCAEDNRARTIARLVYAHHHQRANSEGLKMVTLTYHHDVEKPELHRTLQHLIQALRRQYGIIEYARFVERTQRGRFHIHLVLDAPFIPQKELSELWRTATHGAFIVDIRAVHSARQVARYVTKYLTKAPATKISFSRGFPNRPLPDDGNVKRLDAPNFHFDWIESRTAERIAAGTEALWSGQPCYPAGPCQCFAHLHDTPLPDGTHAAHHHPLGVPRKSVV